MIDPGVRLDRLRGTAERLLSERFSKPVRLGVPERLGGTRARSTVARCTVIDGPPTAPPAVVIKHYHGDASAPPVEEEPWTPERRFLNEWAGLRLLNQIPGDPPLGPRLFGGDRQTALLVLEDLGDGPCLADVLVGEDRGAALTACERYAAGMGRLHAATAGWAHEYRRLRAEFGAPLLPYETPGSTWLEQEVPAFLEGCRQAGVEPAVGLHDEVQMITVMLREPGGWQAFSPGDTCPDNHRLQGDHLRFFDLEFGGFRHALLDAAYLRVPFPTCWCVNRLPADLVPRLEAIYRSELAQACPGAHDDATFEPAMVAICAYWTIITLGWDLRQSLAEDFQWGIASVRQRHQLRLETLSTLTEQTGYLPAISTTARSLLARLRDRWPEIEMPIYPPFRQP